MIRLRFQEYCCELGMALFFFFVNERLLKMKTTVPLRIRFFSLLRPFLPINTFLHFLHFLPVFVSLILFPSFRIIYMFFYLSLVSPSPPPIYLSLSPYKGLKVRIWEILFSELGVVGVGLKPNQNLNFPSICFPLDL